MPYTVGFFLLNRDASYRCALPAVASFTLSPIVHEAGAVQLTYPVGGRNFDMLREHSDANSDVELAVWVDGADTGDTVLLMADDSDDVDEAAVWTFTGHFGTVRLEDAVIEPRAEAISPPGGATRTEAAQAAELIRARMAAGLQMFEDWTWNGAPAIVGIHNDGLIEAYQASGQSNAQAWLASYVAANTSDNKPTEDVAAYRAYSATAGQIMRTLMLEANARGTLTDLTWSTFGNATDSAGAAWSKVITLKIAPGVNYLEVLQALVSYDLCEFRMVGRSLRLFNPGTSAVDRTIGPNTTQVVLRKGRDVTDSPRKRDVRGAATDLLIAGGEGIYRRVFDSVARARFGRQREQYRSVGSITDSGALLAYGGIEMQRAKNGKLSITHGLSFANPATPRPLIDFRPGDWVWSDTGRPTGMERLQVAQVTIVGDANGAQTGSAGLNDLIASREAQLARRIKGIEGGATLTGTSQARPVTQAPDTSTPRAPLGLGVGTEGIPGANGGSWSVVTATWAPVLQNTDSTVLDDLDRYVVRWRYQAGQGLSSAWTVQGSPLSGTAFSWSPVVSGVAIDVAVQAVDRAGNASVWSDTVAATTAADVTPPPVLSAPVTVSELGLLLADWNGRGSANEVMPAKFSHAEVHVSTTNGFTPSDATYYDRLVGAGTMPISIGTAGYGTTFYVKLVAVSRAGVKAAASAQSVTVLNRIADGEIADMSISKLRVGIMSAIMTISGIIRTASAGARVELDSAGLRCYSSTGALLFDFSIPASLLTIAGRLVAGAGIGVGPTVDINPTNAGIDYYPGATGTRIRHRAFTGTDPGGITGVAMFIMQTLNAAGAEAGSMLQTSASNIWLYHRVAGAIRGSRLYLGGPGQAAGALLGFTDSTVGVNAAVQVVSNGDVQIGGTGAVRVGANGEFRVTSPSARFDAAVGTGGSGFSFKVQGLGDAGFRTYFDAADNCIRFVDNQGGNYVSDGTPGGRKSFVIDHPLDPDRWLVHVATESPQALVEYHGVADLVDGAAEVELPAYFAELTEPGAATVQASMLLPDTPDVRYVEQPPPPADLPGVQRPPLALPEHAQVYAAAASRPVGGRFRIACGAPDGARVAWHVIAPRRDSAFDVEPRRDSVDVHGEDPYRYLTPRTATPLVDAA